MLRNLHKHFRHRHDLHFRTLHSTESLWNFWGSSYSCIGAQRRLSLSLRSPRQLSDKFQTVSEKFQKCFRTVSDMSQKFQKVAEQFQTSFRKFWKWLTMFQSNSRKPSENFTNFYRTVSGKRLTCCLYSSQIATPQHWHTICAIELNNNLKASAAAGRGVKPAIVQSYKFRSQGSDKQFSAHAQLVTKFGAHSETSKHSCAHTLS